MVSPGPGPSRRVSVSWIICFHHSNYHKLCMYKSIFRNYAHFMSVVLWFPPLSFGVLCLYFGTGTYSWIRLYHYVYCGNSSVQSGPEVSPKQGFFFTMDWKKRTNVELKFRIILYLFFSFCCKWFPNEGGADFLLETRTQLRFPDAHLLLFKPFFSSLKKGTNRYWNSGKVQKAWLPACLCVMNKGFLNALQPATTIFNAP